MTNPYGWHLPVSDQMIEQESPYAPLEDPAENIAERLMMFAHLAFNSKVWGYQTGNAMRYWPALGEHVEHGTNAPTVAAWWGTVMTNLPGIPLRSVALLHEKNLLCHPTLLPGTPVNDADVLMVLRTHTLDLRDRTRVWAKFRRDMRAANAALTAIVDADNLADTYEEDEDNA